MIYITYNIHTYTFIFPMCECAHVHVCTHTHCRAHVDCIQVRGQAWESVLSFHRMDSRDPTQVVSLGEDDFPCWAVSSAPKHCVIKDQLSSPSMGVWCFCRQPPPIDTWAASVSLLWWASRLLDCGCHHSYFQSNSYKQNCGVAGFLVCVTQVSSLKVARPVIPFWTGLWLLEMFP